MTTFCDWVALFSFFAAFVVCLTSSSKHWFTFTSVGLMAWALPIALTASHVIK